MEKNKEIHILIIVIMATILRSYANVLLINSSASFQTAVCLKTKTLKINCGILSQPRIQGFSSIEGISSKWKELSNVFP